MKNPDAMKMYVETSWSKDEMEEFKGLMEESMDMMKSLPEETQ